MTKKYITNEGILSFMRFLVTGGAGFIGSYLAEYLLKQDHEVIVLDNLSSGDLANIKDIYDDPNLHFIMGDCTDEDILNTSLDDVDAVFHLAANPEVRLSIASIENSYHNNILATYVLMNSLLNKGIKKIIFASSSTVYGEAKIIPTPESYGPLKPISFYGASKLACEAIISSFCYSFDIDGVLFRPANIVGPKATHGVIVDFINKLRENPEELLILGDGTQTKSYLYVEDCVRAIYRSFECMKKGVNIYNVGSDSQINVNKIAQIIISEMDLKDVKLNYSGGVDGGRGWIGDVKAMLLDISKLKSIGWTPKYDSFSSVKMSVKSMLKNM